MYKLNDGDIVKFLPFMENGKSIFFKKYDIFYYNDLIIYDDKDFLRKLYYESDDANTRRGYFIRYLFHSYINGVSKMVFVTRTLFELISNNINVCDINSNEHIQIVEKDFLSHNSTFYCQKESFITKKDFILPIEIKENWAEYLLNNNINLEIYEKNNVFKHRQLLSSVFGNDAVATIIKKDRNNKINKILNKI